MESIEVQIFLKHHITDLLSYLGAIQGVILAIVVFNYPRQHKISNRILALFILLQAHCLIAPRIVEGFPFHYMGMIYAIRYIGVITLYLYIKSLYQKIRWKHQWWHLLIILTDGLLFYIRISVMPEGHNFRFSGILIDYINVFWFFSVIVLYLSLSLKSYKEYKDKVLKFYQFS